MIIASPRADEDRTDRPYPESGPDRSRGRCAAAASGIDLERRVGQIESDQQGPVGNDAP